MRRTLTAAASLTVMVFAAASVAQAADPQVRTSSGPIAARSPATPRPWT